MPTKSDPTSPADDGASGSAEVIQLRQVPGKTPDDGKKKKRTNQSRQLIELFDKNWKLMRDESNAAFARPVSGPNIALPLNEAVNEIVKAFYDLEQKAPAAFAVTEAKKILDIRSRGLEKESVPLRVGWLSPEKKDVILIDMGGSKGETIEVSKRGWKVVPRSRRAFRRTEVTEQMFDPRDAAQGAVDGLRELFNVNDQDWDLIVNLMVTYWVPEIDHIVLVLQGKPGNTKSSLSKMVVDLVDPSHAALMGMTNNRQDLIVHALGSWVIGFENVSKISQEVSDLICSMVTGGAQRKRKLYSDGNVYANEFWRTIVMNGVHITGMRPDLVDRSVMIDLRPVAEDQRKTKEECAELFEVAAPAMVRYLLDTLVGAMRARASKKHELTGDRSRMADAEQWLRYCDVARRTNSVRRYGTLYKKDAQDAAQDHSLTVAIEQYLRLKGRKADYTAKEWLLRLIPPSGADQRDGDWPSSARGFTQVMRLNFDGLRSAGWTVREHTRNRLTRWEIGLPDASEGS